MKLTFITWLLSAAGLFISAFPAIAQNYSHQLEAGFSAIRVSDKKHGGLLYQNRYTAFVHPKVGLAGTFGLLTSSYFPARGQYATRLMDQFQKNYLMADLSAVYMPLQRGRHSIRLLAGASWRQRAESEVTSAVLEDNPYSSGRWVVHTQFTKRQDVGFHAGVGYEYAFTPRFSSGIEFTGYNYDKGASVLALGIQGRYKFAISKESLGFAGSHMGMTGWGIKGGLNVAELVEFSYFMLNRKSFHAGLFADFAMRKNFSFRTELLYSGKGARTPLYEINIPGYSFPTRMVFQLHYLDVPFLINYRLYKGLQLYTGVQPGFLLAQKAKVRNGSSSLEGGNKVELSVAAGTRYEFSRVHVDVRYTHGVISIADRNNANNQVFQASVGYRLSKK